MRHLFTIFATTTFALACSGVSLAATPATYIVDFRSDDSPESQRLDTSLANAMAISRVNAEHVVIDTSTAAKWEKGAHEAFDRDIVPIFNNWVGLPGFAAVVDASTKQVLGCVNSSSSTNEIAAQLKAMASRATGNAYLSNASSRASNTQCPPVFNVDPGQ